MEVYAAMVDVLDQNIGRLVAHLKAKGAWENTLFLFCADNGACPFDRTKGREFDPIQGKSLVPILKGKKRKGHATIYQQFGTDRALRQGDWKVVAAKGGRWELYNLQKDRTELNDLKTKHPERAQGMIEEWFRIAKNVDRLKGGQLKRGNGELSRLKFGVRNDPGAKEETSGKRKKRKKTP
jgi:arylsulfatase A-like enzyme